ncbi:uncharacterized protein C8Q71DRAFT_885624 [Rhodofomes roseus]|uniref:HECT-type E3 ubiquitin transferase n=1 Tax=Rhodofomes roseus TaxID=34475 RepID=A0ABQ8KVI8_9APHY|nr:uncharacterized protein C8Q71DRAFT_885624 [Rhodofomes roseus]KAH9842053.1 hypothetical protein C8Q71DRAFT_885624 [Rhodofomes roseus]
MTASARLRNYRTRYESLRVAIIEGSPIYVSTSINTILERGFLPAPPSAYYTLYPRALDSTAPAAPSILSQSKSANLIHLEGRVAVSSEVVEARTPEEVAGRADWEDNTEKREASLRERKAQMILAARRRRRRQQQPFTVKDVQVKADTPQVRGLSATRRPFKLPDHWLVTSQVDVIPFIQAAILEERNLEQSSNARTPTKWQVAYMSPRLGVLNDIPFAIPFEVRVSIFRQFVASDLVARGLLSTSRRHALYPKTRVIVRRESVAQGGFEHLGDIDLHAPVAITLEVVHTGRGLWSANKKNGLYSNPHSYATEAHSLTWYRFIGRILGKALYDGIIVDVAFAGFFLAKWLGQHINTGDPEELSLNFTVVVQEFDVARTVDLIPNGSNIVITPENRLQYIFLVSHYRLTKQIKEQSEAFFEGLSEMITPRWLRMFNQQEL